MLVRIASGSGCAMDPVELWLWGMLASAWLGLLHRCDWKDLEDGRKTNS